MHYKKIIKAGILTAMLTLLVYFGHRIYALEQTRKAAEKLPSFVFQTVDGKPFTRDMLQSDYTHIIINHFSPDCEFCQYMTTQIKANRQALGRSIILMVTEAGTADVQKFIDRYALRAENNIRVLRDSGLYFYTRFGTMAAPCFFVYDGNRQLTKRVIGESKVENLIR